MPLDIIRLIEIFSVSYGTIWFSRWLDNRKARKQNDMDKEFARKKRILPILEDIRYHLEAARVMEIAFSNGDSTFTGHHLKKLSVVSEVTREGIENIAHHFQLIPTKKFERFFDHLYESPDDYVISNENVYRDDLSNLNKLFDMRYIMVVTIRDQVNRWVGVIIVSFEKERPITGSEIAFVKTQASIIGGLK